MLGKAELDAVSQWLFNGCWVKGKVSSSDLVAVFLDVVSFPLRLGVLPGRIYSVVCQNLSAYAEVLHCFLFWFPTLDHSPGWRVETLSWSQILVPEVTQRTCCAGTLLSFVVPHHHCLGTTEWDLPGSAAQLHSVGTAFPSLLSNEDSRLCFITWLSFLRLIAGNLADGSHLVQALLKTGLLDQAALGLAQLSRKDLQGWRHHSLTGPIFSGPFWENSASLIPRESPQCHLCPLLSLPQKSGSIFSVRSSQFRGRRVHHSSQSVLHSSPSLLPQPRSFSDSWWGCRSDAFSYCCGSSLHFIVLRFPTDLILQRWALVRRVVVILPSKSLNLCLCFFGVECCDPHQPNSGGLGQLWLISTDCVIQRTFPPDRIFLLQAKSQRT